MYKKIKDLTTAQQIEILAKELVQIPSVNGSQGERQVADKITEILLSFPYFQQHPNQVWQETLPQDALKRKNVFAFLPKADTQKTLIFHAHLDTVGVEDFGSQQDLAFQPDALLEFFKNYQDDPEVQQEALSGDWLFGRGMLDMKSGIAVHLANFLYYSKNLAELPANLLLMINPVEENDHLGVIAAVPTLKNLRKEKNLEYVAAINDDFISPSDVNEEQRIIYTGAAGKLLTCFYIKGREIHVGDALAGLDPTLIASGINLKINMNLALCEELTDEEILPSSCLLQRDLKDFYNVQTAKTAKMYFNTFLYERPVEWVLQQMKTAAISACQEISQSLGENYRKFAANSGARHAAVSHEIEVLTFKEYAAQLAARGIDVEQEIQTFAQRRPTVDKRDFGFQLMDYLEYLAQSDCPKVVIFFAPPFCPHNYLQQTAPLHAGLKAALRAFGEQTGEKFHVRRFFPYLSDSSYLSMNESDAEIGQLIENFPGMTAIYPLPVKAIQALNIPALDIGVYGKGAHTWKERLYKPYSYEILPKLIRFVSARLSQLGNHEEEKQ